MNIPIRVGILDDHQAILDGYLSRLSQAPDIQVVFACLYGDELEPAIQSHPCDVLLLDIEVPNNAVERRPFPVFHLIPRLLERHPNCSILVISMFNQRALIHSVMNLGVMGYLVKDDAAAVRELASIVRTIASGGIYLSSHVFAELMKRDAGEFSLPLSPRQVEAISLCAAYPEASTEELARRLNIAGSTLRNLLSTAYVKLDVRSRAMAVEKARQAGIITPFPRTPNV